MGIYSIRKGVANTKVIHYVYLVSCRVEAGIMRQLVLWYTACNFNAVILNQSIFNCLIASDRILVLWVLSN